jgi:hypothetical protein
MTKIRNPKRDLFAHWILELGIYLGFVIWDLEFWVDRPT